MCDVRLEMACDAGVSALKQQDATLGNVRNRATGILGVAALVTTFGGGIGLINTDPKSGPVFPSWAAISLLMVLLSIGILVMSVQWPVQRWSHGLHPILLLEKIDRGDELDLLRRDLVVELGNAMKSNRAVIVRCTRLYRLAAALLLVEVLVLGAGLFTG